MTVTRTAFRSAAAGAALVVGLGGLAGCGDSAGPEAGAVTTQQLTDLQEQVGALEERLGVLEESGDRSGDPTEDAAPGGEPVAGAGDSPLFTDPASLVGEEVTVSAGVMEVLPTTSSGSAFTIGGQGEDEAVAVLSTGQPVHVDVDDVVQVTGTVVLVSRERFEQDFGTAPGDLLTDVDAFLMDEEGDVAIDASQVRVLQELEGSA